jgi:hypothetical protein
VNSLPDYQTSQWVSGVHEDGVVPDAVKFGDAFADADGAVAGGMV